MVRKIRAGRYQDALLDAVTPRRLDVQAGKGDRVLPGFMRRRLNAKRRVAAAQDWQSRFLELAQQESPGSTRRLLDHYFRRRNVSDFYAYRWGQPKLLASISLVSIGPENTGPSLDLGCGAGHLTRFLQARNPSHPSVGMDANFFLTWIAKHRISPGAFFVCADAEDGIPFGDSQFATVVLSNFLHFLDAKQLCIHESERVAQRDGVVCITSLRHSKQPAQTRNLAISPRAYDELFSTPRVFVTERRILDRYAAGQGPALDESDNAIELDNSPLINIVASRCKTVFKDHDHFTGQSALERNKLKVNPLFEPSNAGNDRVYKRRWPSEFFVGDNPWIDVYLPASVVCDSGVWRGVLDNETVVDESQLVRLCVLLDLPENY